MSELPLESARIISVVETTLKRRGNGVDDPIRIVTQYWSPDGELLAERDPMLVVIDA